VKNFSAELLEALCDVLDLKSLDQLLERDTKRGKR
jgi:hypothetical protein